MTIDQHGAARSGGAAPVLPGAAAPPGAADAPPAAAAAGPLAPAGWPPGGTASVGTPPVRRGRAECQHIPGWGADLAHAQRPGVPMERTPPRFIDPPAAPLPAQPRTVEVFVSPERTGITPVFGSAQPPRGLSGWLRRAAYRQTENDLRHWLLLLLADRIDMVEGVGDDLRRGHVPNVLGEMGMRAAWRYNRAGVLRNTAVLAAAGGLAWYLLRRRAR